MDALGGPPDGETDNEHALLIGEELAATHVESGYKFDYQRTSIDSYHVTATPLQFGKSGGRNFFLDESGVIRFTEEDRQATANDAMLKGPYWQGAYR